MKSLLIIVFVLLGFSSLAQQNSKDTLTILELNEITIVGDKNNKITGSGQYISFKKIQQLNQTNVNNVLRNVPGVYIRDEEGFGLRPNIGLRGTSVNRSAKITLMEDGILIAPATYSDPSAYYFPTFARMEGVEVLKGSSQIKYGPYTIGGAINLLSTFIPNSFAGLVELSYGSFTTNQERIWLGDSRKNIDYVFEINRIASNGFKQIDGGGNTGFDRRDILGKLRWHTDKNARIPQAITLKFVNTTEESKETYLGLTYQDYKKNPLRRYAGSQKDELILNHQDIVLNYIIQPFKNLTVNSSFYYTKTFREWGRANNFDNKSINTILNEPDSFQTAYKIMSGQINGDLGFQAAARTYNSLGLQFHLNYQINTKEFLHNFQFGFRQHADKADRYATNSTFYFDKGRLILKSAGVLGNSENQLRSAETRAAFFNYDLEFRGLKISPGVRIENILFHFENFGTYDYARQGADLKTAANKLLVVLPGLGFNYNLTNQMNIFGGLYKGFSPPGAPSTSSTTTQAQAEISLNYELGYRLAKTNLNLQIVAFVNNYDNILGSDNISGGGAGTGDMFNAGKAKIQGIELSFGYDLLKNKRQPNKVKIPISFVYTYTIARFLETFINAGGDWGSGTINKGDFIPFVSPHLLTSSIGLEYKSFNFSINGRYIGATRIKPGKNEFIFPQQYVQLNQINSLKGFVIVDLSTNYQISQTFTVFTLINNLTNNKAIVANLPQGYRPNIPLSLQLGIKAKLN